MANQAQRQDDEQANGDSQRADPRRAQYVINLTPEQYESQLRQGVPKEVPPRTQIEMGGSGTATVSFKDAADGDVAITSAVWSATGPVVVTADAENPASAKIVPMGLGPATVTVEAQSDNGSATAHTDLMVIDVAGAPVTGTIEIAVEAGSGEGGVSYQSAGQILPVPATAPPRDAAHAVPPAQVLAQPSPQPQPQEEVPPPTEEIPPPEARRD